MEFTNNFILEPQNSRHIQCVPTHTNERSMEIKETYLNNKWESGMDRIVLINNEIIGSQEIFLPQISMGNMSAANNNSRKGRNKNDVLLNSNAEPNDLVTLEFKSEMSPTLCEDNLNNFVPMQKYETLPCLREFDEVLKEFQDIRSNNTGLLIPTLSETEYLLNSISTNENVLEREKIVPIDSTTKHEDSESFSTPDEIIFDIDSNEYVSIQKNSNYIKIPTRNNTTQLSPEIYFKTENVDEKTKIFSEFNEDVNNKFSETLNDTKFQMEFESYLNKRSKYNFSYELLVESANTEVNEDTRVNVSSEFVKIDNTRVNASSGKTVDFNLASDEDIETILSSSTHNELFQDENSNATSDCDGYNSSDFEFITEDEACLEGLITNLYQKDKTNELKTVIAHNSNFEKYFKDIGPSNGAKYSEDIDNFQEQHRSDHVIPNHEEYLELFSQPWSVYSFEAENKAFYSTKTMHVEVDNICFNVGLLQKRHEENKIDLIFQKEAKENAKKIISMYPTENRKRRRKV